MMLVAFHTSHSLHSKGAEKKNVFKNYTKFLLPKCTNLDKSIIQRLHNMSIKQTIPRPKTNCRQDFKGQSLYFNHRISFDTKRPISPSLEGNSYIMVIVDAFTHYVALNTKPQCNAYYAYTTLYEHWIAKLGLPEILVTDNGTEFINNGSITLCHLYNFKHKPRTSHAPWTNRLVEGMKRSLQEYLRCIINGNDTRYT